MSTFLDQPPAAIEAYLNVHGVLDVSRLAAHVRAVGKDRLDNALLGDLAQLRRRLEPTDRLRHAFVDCVLDKYECRYFYGSYICAPVLSQVDPALPDRHRVLIRLLISDALLQDLVPNRQLRELPPAAVVTKRVRHGARIVTTFGGQSEFNRSEDLIAALEYFQAVRAEATAVLAAHGVDASGVLDASLLPVDTYSDERLFLRVLQSYEAVFVYLAQRLVMATGAVGAGDLPTAEREVNCASTVLADAAGLFRLIATMQVTSFRAFREKTTGASAIQSEAYKYFESTCAPPSEERLASPAFSQTPLTQAQLGTEPDTLLGALETHLARHGGSAAAADLLAAMQVLDDVNTQWRVTHLGLAARFLSDLEQGSGYTEGVPYLCRVRDQCLFGLLPEVER